MGLEEIIDWGVCFRSQLSTHGILLSNGKTDSASMMTIIATMMKIDSPNGRPNVWIRFPVWAGMDGLQGI